MQGHGYLVADPDVGIEKGDPIPRSKFHEEGGQVPQWVRFYGDLWIWAVKYRVKRAKDDRRRPRAAASRRETACWVLYMQSPQQTGLV